MKRLAINANGNTITSFAGELNPTGVGEYIYIYIYMRLYIKGFSIKYPARIDMPSNPTNKNYGKILGIQWHKLIRTKVIPTIGEGDGGIQKEVPQKRKCHKVHDHIEQLFLGVVL